MVSQKTPTPANRNPTAKTRRRQPGYASSPPNQSKTPDTHLHIDIKRKTLKKLKCYASIAGRAGGGDGGSGGAGGGGMGSEGRFRGLTLISAAARSLGRIGLAMSVLMPAAWHFSRSLAVALAVSATMAGRSWSLYRLPSSSDVSIPSARGIWMSIRMTYVIPRL